MMHDIRIIKSLHCWHSGSFRADSRLAPSQWETSLQSNAVSHWLGANLESALGFITHRVSNADRYLMWYHHHAKCNPQAALWTPPLHWDPLHKQSDGTSHPTLIGMLPGKDTANSTANFFVYSRNKIYAEAWTIPLLEEHMHKWSIKLKGKLQIWKVLVTVS